MPKTALDADWPQHGLRCGRNGRVLPDAQRGVPLILLAGQRLQIRLHSPSSALLSAVDTVHTARNHLQNDIRRDHKQNSNRFGAA